MEERHYKHIARALTPSLPPHQPPVPSAQSASQVVVSAATGVLGLPKNVMDVWCNTTFLGEEGNKWSE